MRRTLFSASFCLSFLSLSAHVSCRAQVLSLHSSQPLALSSQLALVLFSCFS